MFASIVYGWTSLDKAKNCQKWTVVTKPKQPLPCSVIINRLGEMQSRQVFIIF